MGAQLDIASVSPALVAEQWAECPDCWFPLPSGHVCMCECGVPISQCPGVQLKPRAARVTLSDRIEAEARQEAADARAYAELQTERLKRGAGRVMSAQVIENMRAGQIRRRERERAEVASRMRAGGSFQQESTQVPL